MNIYGYCRISTAKQSIDRQIRNIKAEYPTAHIVQEACVSLSLSLRNDLKSILRLLYVIFLVQLQAFPACKIEFYTKTVLRLSGS